MKLTPEIETELRTQEEKYFNLVWYARSQNRENFEYWDTVPHDIRRGAFNAQLDVETRYPEEVESLYFDDSNWQHGFNSGALAVFRFLLTALDDSMIEDECEGGLIPAGGLKQALEEFPFLDT